MNNSDLKELCRQIRCDIINMVTDASSGHPGGSLSCVELIEGAFSQMRVDPKNPAWPERDRFVLSKGHCAPALYAEFVQLS